MNKLLKISLISGLVAGIITLLSAINCVETGCFVIYLIPLIMIGVAVYVLIVGFFIKLTLKKDKTKK